MQGYAQRPSTPPTGYHKIHVDAAVRQGRGGSVSTVCRDGNGIFIGSSSLVVMGIHDPTTLEAMAVREALALGEDLHISNMVISSDCKQVIGDIQKGSDGRYGAIIKEIKLQTATSNCIFKFESRRVNLEAHNLARHSLTLGPGRHVWFGQSHNQNCIPHNVIFDK